MSGLGLLFEEDSVTEKERLFQLEQFGKLAGWDDPAMDMYDDLDPRVLVTYLFSL